MCQRHTLRSPQAHQAPVRGRWRHSSQCCTDCCSAACCIACCSTACCTDCCTDSLLLQAALPAEWAAYTDEASSNVYYYNATAGTSEWFRPMKGEWLFGSSRVMREWYFRKAGGGTGKDAVYANLEACLPYV